MLRSPGAAAGLASTSGRPHTLRAPALGEPRRRRQPAVLPPPAAAALRRRRSRGVATPHASTTLATTTASDDSSDESAMTDAPSTIILSEPASRTLVDLATAWDVLAPRLPAFASDGEDGGVLLEALKLAVAAAGGGRGGGGGGGGGRGGPADAAARPGPASPSALAAGAALGTAARLADLAARGVPLDTPAIAAGIVADAAAAGRVTLAAAAARLGPEPAAVLADVLKVRALPRRADVYDDAASSALRELALTFYDARAAMVEVAARAATLEALTAGAATSPAAAADVQVAALEALQIYAPLGHALGMGPVAAELEDACFRTLFPESYGETARWLRAEAAAYSSALEACRVALADALAADPALAALAAGCEIHARTKSLFSTMKKLLRLDDFASGGRDRASLFDLLGMRVIVLPHGMGRGGGGGGGGGGGDSSGSEWDGEESGGGGPADPPADPAAEADACAACYRVLEVAESLWPVLPGRTKDYIAAPKENGYRSLHATLRPDTFAATVDVEGRSGGLGGSGDAVQPAAEPARPAPTLELQIRTAAMHAAAESGDAAHTAYKGGLARRQAAALAAWSARSAAALAAASATASTASDSDGEASASTSTSPAALISSAAALFRHLDTDGDGSVSAAELGAALRDMGSADAAAADAAAALVRAARASSGGEGDRDGDPDAPLTLAEFSELVQRASVVASLPAVDAATAESLRRQLPPAH